MHMERNLKFCVQSTDRGPECTCHSGLVCLVKSSQLDQGNFERNMKCYSVLGGTSWKEASFRKSIRFVTFKLRLKYVVASGT